MGLTPTATLRPPDDEGRSPLTQGPDRMSEPFAAFVGKASEGRNSLPRILIGTVIIVVVWFGGTVALVAGGAFLAALDWLPQGWLGIPSGNAFNDFIQSRIGLAAAILTLAFIWPGIWLALRFVHRRRLRGILGASGRVAGGDFWRGAGATLIVAVLVSLLNLWADPRVVRSDLPVGTWLLFLPPLALILLAQTSAEEALFRGYLLQNLAHRFRSFWIWAVLPAALFAAGHWYPGAQPWMNAMVLFSIFLFAMAAVVLVRVTGNLGAAFGVHFANNVVALLFVASGVGSQSLSLYVAPPIEAPIWTVTDAIVGGVMQVVLTAVILALLLWRGSPLRLSRAS
jgi:membrane protease YdiL (CAAX protease family)